MTDEEIHAYCEQEGFERTGAFASKEALAVCVSALVAATSAPMVKVAGGWLHEAAQVASKETIHAAALEGGLPELPPLDGEPDKYGLIPQTGEFIKLRRAQ